VLHEAVLGLGLNSSATDVQPPAPMADMYYCGILGAKYKFATTSEPFRIWRHCNRRPIVCCTDCHV